MSTHACTTTIPAHGEILGRRCLAYFVDGVVVWVAFGLASFVVLPLAPLVIAGFLVTPALGVAAFVALALLGLAAPFVPFAIVMSLWEGQTPGHRLVGIRIVSDDGEPITARRAFVREFVAKGLVLHLRWLVTLGVLFIADLVRALRRPEEPLWHDTLCRTHAVAA